MKIKFKKPKIKISAPKAVTKAISSVTKPLETVAKGAIKSTGDIASSALKGDIKGVAGGALGAVDTLKEAGKQAATGQLGLGTGALGMLGGLTGSKDISKLAGNISREGQKGINEYGDVAMDIGANVATSGGYGAAKTATQGLASEGLKGLISGKGLQEAALQAAGSYAGVDPNMLKTAEMGLKAAQGDLKGAALQGLGSYGGFDPNKLQLGISALTGDKAGLVSGLASQAGAGKDLAGAAGQLASGKKAEEIAMQQALKMGRGIASDKASAYAKDLGLDQMQKDLQNKFKSINVKNLPGAANVEKINQVVSAGQKSLISTGKKTLAQIAQEQGIDPKELLKMNPQLKGVDSSIAKGQELFLKPTMKEPGMMEKAWEGIKGGAKKIPGAISSALSSAKEFAAENKTGLGLGADVLAAGAGYMAGEAARKEAKGLSEQQLKELKGAGAAFEKMQYDPERYRQEREFLQQRIAGGGITPQEKKMQQEGDIRAARAAAAQRLSGVEQQARMGRGVTGSGASLAASLAGGQSVMGEQSATNLAREASASQRLEQDIQRQTNLARQKTAEEAQLAQEQGQFGLSRAQQTGAVRGDLGNLALGRAAALQNLAGQGAEMAKRGLSMMDTPEQPPVQQQQPEQQPQAQTPPAVSQAKVGGAKRLAQGGQPAPKPAPVQQQPAAQKFNQQNTPQPGQGQGYGVYAPVQQAQQTVQKVQSGVQQAQQTVQKVQQGAQKAQQTAQSTIDAAKKKAEELRDNPLGFFGIKS